MTDLKNVARGDTLVLAITVHQPAGSTTPYPSPSDLDMWVTIKRDATDADADALWRGSTKTGDVELADSATARFESRTPRDVLTAVGVPAVLSWAARVRESDGTTTTVDSGWIWLGVDIAGAELGRRTLGPNTVALA